MSNITAVFAGQCGLGLKHGETDPAAVNKTTIIGLECL